MIVVACNTATAFALDVLKRKLSIPVIGVIQPGARAAIKSTKNNQIAIIGTEGTIQSNAYPNALKAINKQLLVTTLSCPLFVPMVEKGMITGDKAYQVVKESLLPLIKTRNIDTLVLGCTHYPLLENTIQKVMGKEVQIISSSEETARETSTILEVHGLLMKESRQPHHYFYTSGNLDLFSKISSQIFAEQLANLQQINVEKIVL